VDDICIQEVLPPESQNIVEKTNPTEAVGFNDA
jgi:hypothetical protein